MGDADDSLKCPISLELFRDPVVAEDGHTYERKNITTWLQAHGTSPLTREPMSHTSLRPNHIVRKLVDEFRLASKEKQHQFRLNVDIDKSEEDPWFISYGKTIYKAEWISKQGPPIILLKIDGVRACREASFYAQLSSHPHIVRTFGIVHSDPSSTLLLQEFTPHRDLSYQLREQEFFPSAEVLLEIFTQMIDALICLSDNDIVHGDVACRHVLAFRLHPTIPERNLFKLTDFGLTKASTVFSVVDSVPDTVLSVKPIRYCAPEILNKKSGHLNYSEKSDVYSMGVLIWEAHSQGQLPFSSIESDTEVKRARRSGEVLERPQSCNDALWSLVNIC
jgi:serine/threonine protein kinase